VREADEALLLGPSTYEVPGSGRRVHTYLDLERLRRALVKARADMAWVGWGFVAERASFAELCRELGVVFIGPAPAVMRRLGDKVEAKRLAESVGVDVAPWSGGLVRDLGHARTEAERIGVPLLIKAAAGGGGRGIRRVDDVADLRSLLESASREAATAFGDDGVFLERVVPAARHVEVQVAADTHGTVWTLGLRDCSVQRRRQKIVEESGAQGVDELTSRRLQDAAARLTRAAGYTGLGTVEFLLDPATGVASFMEVNTRLQVEHTVTEETTGIDLVKLGLDLARGMRLSGAPPTASGWAIEARITAEDPLEGFRPSPGRVVLCRLATGPGLRTDAAIREGDEVTGDFDPLLLKIIAHGRDRAEALARLRRGVEETCVVLEGGATTSGFVRRLLADERLLAGGVDSGWADRLVDSGEPLAEDRADVALVAAAIELADDQRRADRDRLLSTAARGRPTIEEVEGRQLELIHRGAAHAFVVHRTGEERYAVETADGIIDVAALAPDGAERLLTVAGRKVRVGVPTTSGGTQVDLDGVSYRMHAEQEGLLRAPSPSVVVGVLTTEGAEVAAGDVIMVLESMKVESSLVATTPGRVRQVFVTPGRQVDAGEPLLHVDQAGAVATPAAGAGERRFASLVGPAALVDPVTAARRRLLGFDAGPSFMPEGETGSDVDAEADVLRLFADCCAVAGRGRLREGAVATRGLAAQELLFAFLRAPERSRRILPQPYLEDLAALLPRYGASSIDVGEPLDEALYRLCRARQALPAAEPLVTAVLRRWLGDARAVSRALGRDALELLERLTDAADAGFAVVGDLARAVAHELFVRPALKAVRSRQVAEAREDLRALRETGVIADRLLASAADVPELLWSDPPHGRDGVVAELLLRRAYRGVDLDACTVARLDIPSDWTELSGAGAVELFVPPGSVTLDEVAERLRAAPAGLDITATVWAAGGGPPVVLTARDGDVRRPGVHPATAERLELWRLREFAVMHVASSGDVHLFDVVGLANPADRRLVVVGGVRALTPIAGREEPSAVPELEHALLEALALLREYQTGVPLARRPQFNRVVLYVDPPWTLPNATLHHLAHRLERATRGLGLEKILARVRVPDPVAGDLRDRLLHVTAPAATGVALGETAPSETAVRPLTPHQQRALKLRRRGLRHPYEIADLLTAPGAAASDFPPGTFTELDLEGDRLVRVDRPPGENAAGVVVGLIENVTAKHPEGMTRVLLLSDPSRGLGALAEPECRRIVAALELAAAEGLPAEWFAVSAGARISMTSGTENMDWVARVLRRIVAFTQAGGELNVVVCGVNVGAQPYFNAEATMLMHTRGILVMTPASSMLLTGKEALDFAGGVSAEDNLGIGGHDRIMGPNGQAQYWAPTLEGACETLFRHYEHTYVAPGERFPRQRATIDAIGRDVRRSPHPALDGVDFCTVGDIFDPVTNPDRRKPFDMRALMRAVVDADADPLERWAAMAGAQTAIVWDVHLGGIPVCLVGIESRVLPRAGIVPVDGPESWSAATLFPASSKKLARALNAASGNRPVVILANLAGFDGSPESLRRLQLEYGAEIGRAVTNFVGPLVFCVVSRYHGGAFVVFSKALNPGLDVLAVEGARASVIGGSAAAAVVFGREVEDRVASDDRVRALDDAWRAAAGAERARLGAQREALADRVRAEVRRAVAREFDEAHTIERALEVGSVDRIVDAAALRPEIIEAVRRGMARAR
jgi:acetyl/propionyl-CoA carboxylase alpha subunit/acetyl-CoA carboxylase carboxyltransferase component